MSHQHSMKLAALVLIMASVILLMDHHLPRIDLNTASMEDLTAIPGIGPSYARRILEERDRRGGFRSVNDLLKVKGIGRKTLNRLRPFVTVNPPEKSGMEQP